MANTTTMTYGDYEFSPVPILSLQKELVKEDDGTIIGTTFQGTLDGVVTPVPGEAGIVNVDTLADELRDAFAIEGKKFEIACGSSIILRSYPRVNGITFEPTNDNWVYTMAFEITLEWDEDDNAEDSSLYTEYPYLRSANEDWSLEFIEDKNKFSWTANGTYEQSPLQLRVTHNVSAVGKRHFRSGVAEAETGTQYVNLEKEAWQQAQDFVKNRVGWSPIDTDDFTEIYGTGMLGGHNVINLTMSSFVPYNHMRTKTINEAGGEFSINETWLVMETGTGIQPGITEDFTATIQTSVEDGLSQVNLEGTIQGLEDRSYGTGEGDFTISTTKYDNAETGWSAISGQLYNRAKHVADTESVSNLNLTPKSTSVGRNPHAGTISYSYEYDTRPCNFVSGALSENIEIVDTSPVDVFAKLVVLGRSKGPVLQDIGTVTEAKRSVAIEVVMAPPTGCDAGDCSTMLSAAPESEVQTVLCCIEQQTSGSWDQMFKSGDSANWNPKTGRYSRNVEWTMTNCDGDAPTTSMC